jgi:transposase
VLNHLEAGAVTVVRVRAKSMAHTRDGTRTVGKSDPIDALAVARPALREPDVAAACLSGDARVVRLLVDHRDDLVAERTRIINRLRWHLRELDPSFHVRARPTGAHSGLTGSRLHLDSRQPPRVARRQAPAITRSPAGCLTTAPGAPSLEFPSAQPRRGWLSSPIFLAIKMLG